MPVNYDEAVGVGVAPPTASQEEQPAARPLIQVGLSKVEVHSHLKRQGATSYAWYRGAGPAATYIAGLVDPHMGPPVLMSL